MRDTLRSEEAIFEEEAICCCSNKVVVTEMMAYQVSSPCVVPLASLRSEETKVPEAICCCGRHGNDVIHMCIKFHFHVCCN